MAKFWDIKRLKDKIAKLLASRKTWEEQQAVSHDPKRIAQLLAQLDRDISRMELLLDVQCASAFERGVAVIDSLKMPQEARDRAVKELAEALGV